MYTRAATTSLPDPHAHGGDIVTSVRSLSREGWTSSGIRAQLRARRWQRVGRAIIRHNGPPSLPELRRAALIVFGPRVLLTSFTSLEVAGLQGWERASIHVLVPRGARVRVPSELPIRVHYTDSWPQVRSARRTLDSRAHAAVLAAGSFVSPRPGCGLLAATVQQRLLRPGELVAAVAAAVRVRHHRLLLGAAHDIAQGAQALSEIDFSILCRRHGLPEPLRQAVRHDASGRRRFVDAEWRTAGGRRVVAEVDGALHLVARRWWADQLRQNELVLTGDAVLRFPSVVVRAEPILVADQLRRALDL